jgi:hypothetical protein
MLSLEAEDRVAFSFWIVLSRQAQDFFGPIFRFWAGPTTASRPSNIQSLGLIFFSNFR